MKETRLSLCRGAVPRLRVLRYERVQRGIPPPGVQGREGLRTVRLQVRP